MSGMDNLFWKAYTVWVV